MLVVIRADRNIPGKGIAIGVSLDRCVGFSSGVSSWLSSIHHEQSCKSRSRWCFSRVSSVFCHGLLWNDTERVFIAISNLHGVISCSPCVWGGIGVCACVHACLCTCVTTCMCARVSVWVTCAMRACTQIRSCECVCMRACA